MEIKEAEVSGTDPDWRFRPTEEDFGFPQKEAQSVKTPSAKRPFGEEFRPRVSRTMNYGLYLGIGVSAIFFLGFLFGRGIGREEFPKEVPLERKKAVNSHPESKVLKPPFHQALELKNIKKIKPRKVLKAVQKKKIRDRVPKEQFQKSKGSRLVLKFCQKEFNRKFRSLGWKGLKSCQKRMVAYFNSPKNKDQVIFFRGPSFRLAQEFYLRGYAFQDTDPKEASYWVRQAGRILAGYRHSWERALKKVPHLKKLAGPQILPLSWEVLEERVKTLMAEVSRKKSGGDVGL